MHDRSFAGTGWQRQRGPQESACDRTCLRGGTRKRAGQNRITSVPFTDAEHAYLAVNLPPDRIEDPDTLELDNALFLLYAVAVISSPDDEQALDEHRTYVITMLGTYKRALGIP